MLLPLQINLSKPPAPVSHFVQGKSGGLAVLYQFGTTYALECPGGALIKGHPYYLEQMAIRNGWIVKFLD